VIGSNHIATGAVIGLSVSNPLIALPAALVSHFILDAFPHFGFKGPGGLDTLFKHRISYFVLFIELVAIPTVFLLILGTGIWVFLAAIIAFSPDFVWIGRYLFWERRGVIPPKYTEGSITRFHAKIQWGERPWGIIIDIVWLILMITTIVQLTS
jgi:hypothetical protein